MLLFVILALAGGQRLQTKMIGLCNLLKHGIDYFKIHPNVKYNLFERFNEIILCGNNYFWRKLKLIENVTNQIGEMQLWWCHGVKKGFSGPGRMQIARISKNMSGFKISIMKFQNLGTVKWSVIWKFEKTRFEKLECLG